MLVINMLIPLLLGLSIYMTSPSSTYLSEQFSKIGIVFPKIYYPDLISFYACDFCWGYALYSGLELFNDGTHKVILPAMLTAAAVEAAQLIPGFPGTFDVLDILVEMMAVMLAVIITTFILGGIKHEKQEAY
ncbi:MAG: hypothetical protein IKE53_09865 [Clostridiales bacterium]|nr:hypothetical protein [Clostridiales bacterium]